MKGDTHTILDQEFIRKANKRTRVIPLFFVAIMVVSVFGITLKMATSSRAATATAFALSVNSEKDNVEVNNNEAFTLQVEVLDESLQTMSDYDGMITVTSSDNNASLPGDYEFKPSDEGIKSFDLGLKLTSPGEQVITVTDVDDPSVVGEITVEVIGAGGGEFDPDTPIILVPNDSDIINKTVVDIVGTAMANTEVTIYDGTEVIGTTESDSDGEFTYTTDTLFTGTHLFVATIEGQNGVILESNEVRITVDDSGPATVETNLSPSTVEPSEMFTVEVIAERGLLEVNMIIDDRSEALMEDPVDSGIYTADIIAPNAPGNYSLDIELVDQSGNDTTYEDQAILTVEMAEIIPVPNQMPVAQASFTPISGASPLTVQFTSEAFDPDGAIISYFWDFGDGTTSTEPNPVHTYEYMAAEGEPGSMQYSATLTVTDDMGDSASAQAKSIDVNGQPVSYIEVLSEVGPGTWLLLILSAGLAFLLQRKVKLAKVRG